MFSFLVDPLASLLYPEFCGHCGAPVENVADGAACSECWSATTLFDDPSKLCPKCGLLLETAARGSSAHLCGLCSEHPYDRALACGVYHKALSASVIHLKKTPVVSSRLVECLERTFEHLAVAEKSIIVPVPLSNERKLQRGFNQAGILAACVSKFSGQPIDEKSLVRIRDTPMHRSAMDRKARESTVKNAFAVVRPKLIEGRSILLVDDLMTSGSTASQCSKVLKKSGAARVDVLSLARAG